MRNGAFPNAFLSRLLGAFRALSLWNQKAVPWRLLLPLLVTTFMTEPAARPYSAENWFVISRTSWTMSGLFIDCERPETPGSLMSWPWIMKLFERNRMPLAEKSTPVANSLRQLAIWLTPGADKAILKTLRK